MYIPETFNIQNPEVLWEFLNQNSLATVISVDQTKPIISHLPLTFQKRGNQIFAEGHLALVNSQSILLADGNSVTCVFQGEQGYVSSSVYGHENVPTWNYQVAHGIGTVQQISRTELEKHLADLVEMHEKSRTSPLRYSDFNQTLLDDYLQEIVGFRIEFKTWEMAFKLSQNRNQQDFQAIVDDLSGCPHSKALSEEMLKNRKQ